MKATRLNYRQCTRCLWQLVWILSLFESSARFSSAQQSPVQLPQKQQLNGEADSASDRQLFSTQAIPESLTPLVPETDATRWLSHHRLRMYGWVSGGYTYSSAGNGLLTDVPSPNRYGNEFLVNGVWLIFDRPTTMGRWSWGFRSDFYAGADAALLRPLNSFGPQGAHLGTDFRQAYLSLRAPGFKKRGIDFNLGRQNVPLGFETVTPPYRPGYSLGYFSLKYEVGSTAALSTLPSYREA